MTTTTPADDASPRYRAVLQLLQTADVIWNASRLFFEKWDLSPSQFNILNLLRLHPEGLSQSDLSRFLITHRSNLTGMVDRLEKRGLVERQEVAGDRRAYRVVLTATGAKLVGEILPGYFAGAEGVLADTSVSRVEELAQELARIAENANRTASDLATVRKPANS